VIIGVPKELVEYENRVGMAPGGVKVLTDRGHTVLVQRGAGTGSQIPDSRYAQAGAEIIADPVELWGRAELVAKVMEPVAQERDWMQPSQIIFGFFRLVALPDLANTILSRRVTAISYETIQLDDGRLPVMQPMSEVAGRLSIQVGANCLQTERGGAGVLLGGVPGVARASVAIIGAGVVGTEAAKIAVGMGATVKVLDVDMQRLAYLDDIHGTAIQTIYSDPASIAEATAGANLVIGAVNVGGLRAPRLVTEQMIIDMKTGSVAVDVAIDRGGCIETARPTTHRNPTYIVHDVVHYAVPNMPASVPRTSTFALANQTFRYIADVADVGLAAAASKESSLFRGINMHNGRCAHPAVAESLELPYEELSF
jgi:alanine dehydrogenase